MKQDNIKKPLALIVLQFASNFEGVYWFATVLNLAEGTNHMKRNNMKRPLTLTVLQFTNNFEAVCWFTTIFDMVKGNNHIYFVF